MKKNNTCPKSSKRSQARKRSITIGFLVVFDGLPQSGG